MMTEAVTHQDVFIGVLRGLIAFAPSDSIVELSQFILEDISTSPDRVDRMSAFLTICQYLFEADLETLAEMIRIIGLRAGLA